MAWPLLYAPAMNAIAKISLALAITFAVLTGAASAARADATCTSLISSFWNHRGGGRIVWVQSTSLQRDSRWAAYSWGTVRYDSSTDTFAGQMSSLFSDRRNGTQPFSSTAADQGEIRIARDGTVSARSLTWGGGWVTLAATCRDNFLTYFDGWSLTTLVFAPTIVPT
jgi:hypothetical protein